jgi:hypothetical protein
MRRNPVLLLRAISIALILENAITEEELAQIEIEESRKKFNFCAPTFFLSSGLIAGLSVGNIILFIYTHL